MFARTLHRKVGPSPLPQSGEGFDPAPGGAHGNELLVAAGGQLQLAEAVVRYGRPYAVVVLAPRQRRHSHEIFFGMASFATASDIAPPPDPLRPNLFSFQNKK